jgi:hypothetical protein
MATLYNADLKPLGQGVATHPYDHATKLFLDDNYRLAPKQSFLYYVCINIDVGILQSVFSGTYSDPASSQDLVEQYETGLLVKKVDLPKFTMSTKTMNAYNRKNIVQTGITYEPISMSFHDDVADVVTTFWNDYYTYYYRDSDYDPTLYQVAHKYQPRLREGWGFTPRNRTLRPFLRNIQIFSLHNKRFTEYLLINPFITSWRHGEHNSVGDTGIMENTMTVAYETVKYKTGYVNPVDVNGFALLHYDNTNSPISTSVTNIYSDAGLVGSIAGAPKDLARPDGTTGGAGLFGSILSAYRAYQGLKKANLSSLAKVTLGSLGVNVLNGAVNGVLNSIFVPTAGGTPGYGGTYSGSQVAVPLLSSSFSPYSSPISSPGISINGLASSLVGGIGLNFNPVQNTSYTRGFNQVNGPSGQPGPTSVRVTDVANNNGTVFIDPSTGQPVTGSYTSQTIGIDGQVVGSVSAKQSGFGAYTSADPTINATTTEITKDQEGQIILRRTYLDGTVMTFNNNNQVLSVEPGAANSQLATPVDTSTLAANGSKINPNQPQYYTDPRTGITYTVNGGTPGQVTNAITGTLGTASGLYAGIEINQGLNNTFLGKSVIGRTVSAGISTYAGKVIGTAVNNGLQPIVNSVTGSISQGFDSLTGKIKNVVSSWTGTGGYNPSKPTENVASVITDDYGTKTTTYKDGTVVNTSPDGTTSVYTPPGANQNSFSNFFNTGQGVNSDSAATIKGSTYGGYVTDRDGNPIRTGDGSYLTYGSGPGPVTVLDQNGLPRDAGGATPGPEYAISPILNESSGQPIFSTGPWAPSAVNTDTIDLSLTEGDTNNESGFFDTGDIG